MGCRRDALDALFALLDAVLTAATIETPAYLSLVPTCQRGWARCYGALNAATMDREQLERLTASYPVSTEAA